MTSPFSPAIHVAIFDAQNPLTISVKYDGTLIIGQNWVPDDQFAEVLSRERLHSKSNRPVVISGDSRVPYDRVALALRSATAAGFHHVYLHILNPAT